MKFLYTDRFAKRYRNLPDHVQARVDGQLALLLGNPRHPSLRSKKMQGVGNIWEFRVTGGHRVTFQIQEGAYLLRNGGTHDILREP